jgi:diguanylate cyclase (GGDEF)-like protein
MRNDGHEATSTSLSVVQETDRVRDDGVSTATTKLVLDLVEERLGVGGVDAVLARAGLTEQRKRLRRFGGRIRVQEKVRLFEAAAIELGDSRFGLLLGPRVLEDPLCAPLRILGRAAGSPLGMLRSITRFAALMDTSVVPRLVGSGRDAAVIAWRSTSTAGITRGDCDYCMSVVSQVPVLFGMPAAKITHDECQLLGHPECRYVLTWQRLRPRLFRRRAGVTRSGDDMGVLVGANERLTALQGAAEDMVMGGSIEVMADRMIDRVDRVVHAAGYALVVQLPGGAVHSRVRGTGESVRSVLVDEGSIETGHPALDGRPVITATIVSANRGFGSIAAVREPGHEFSPDDVDTLLAYANHAAVGLEMSVLLAEANRQRETSELLLQVARALSTHSDVDQVSRRVAEAVPVLSGADRASVCIWDDELQVLRTRATTGVPDALAEAVAAFSPSPFESPEVAALLSDPTPLLVDEHSSDWARAMLVLFEVDAVLVTPIVVDGDVRGAILAGWGKDAPPTLQPAYLERVEGLASLAAVALENARLAEMDRWQALHDPLTLLPNRRYFEARLRDAHADAVRSAHRVGVLFCDIDRFKSINDTFGHSAGDTVLAAVADRLRAGVREGDVVARLSGDEFVILAEIRDGDELGRIADRVRAQLEEPIVIADGRPVLVGVAIGMAMSDRMDAIDPASGPTDGSGRRAGDPEIAGAGLDDPVHRILATADRRMYEAKAAAAGVRPTIVS